MVLFGEVGAAPAAPGDGVGGGSADLVGRAHGACALLNAGGFLGWDARGVEGALPDPPLLGPGRNSGSGCPAGICLSRLSSPSRVSGPAPLGSRCSVLSVTAAGDAAPASACQSWQKTDGHRTPRGGTWVACGGEHCCSTGLRSCLPVGPAVGGPRNIKGGFQSAQERNQNRTSTFLLEPAPRFTGGGLEFPLAPRRRR